MKDAYSRVCLYLTSCVPYVPDPENTNLINTALQLYRKFGQYPQAMRLALQLHDFDLIKQLFDECPDKLVSPLPSYIVIFICFYHFYKSMACQDSFKCCFCLFFLSCSRWECKWPSCWAVSRCSWSCRRTWMTTKTWPRSFPTPTWTLTSSPLGVKLVCYPLELDHGMLSTSHVIGIYLFYLLCLFYSLLYLVLLFVLIFSFLKVLESTSTKYLLARGLYNSFLLLLYLSIISSLVTVFCYYYFNYHQWAIICIPAVKA